MSVRQDKRQLAAVVVPTRPGYSRRMLIDHWAAGDCMHDLQGWCWPGLMGQSPTRKILHYVSERARTDHPYRGSTRSVSQHCICCEHSCTILSPTGLPVRPPARSEEAGRLRNAVATSARWSYLPLAKSYCRYSAMKILSNQPKVSAGDNSGRGHRWRCVRVLARCFNQLKHVN